MAAGATSRDAQGAHSRESVTVWDLMRPFTELHEFISLSNTMGHTAARVNATESALSLKDDSLGEAARSAALSLYADLEPKLSTLKLRCTLASCRKILALLRSQTSQATFGQISCLQEELYGRLVDESKDILLLALEGEEKEAYNNPRVGWEEIIARFGTTVEDIEEARRCYALERYAAAVFHSLHVVETCLVDLGSFIGVNDPKSGWTAVSNRLAKIMNTKYGDRTPFERDNFIFLEQVHGTVEALKNAWRNKISHPEGKLHLLSREFTPAIAEEILFTTRSFARRLADGLPQSQPTFVPPLEAPPGSTAS